MSGVARHAVDLKPRWADMDAYGHVNNVTWLEYVQEARVDLFAAFAAHPDGGMLVEGVVVARVVMDYRRPLVFRPEPVRIEMWVSAARPASFTIDYEILDRGVDGTSTVYVTAQTVMVPVTLDDGRPRRLRPDETAVLDGLRDE